MRTQLFVGLFGLVTLLYCNLNLPKMNPNEVNLLFQIINKRNNPIAQLPGSNKINIGGKISGIGANQWVKIKEGNSTITLTENKNLFYYILNFPKGQEYLIEVVESSPFLDCTISNASGIAETDITNADVNCVFNPPPTPYTVGGTVTGLSGSITLNMTGNVPQTKVISSNGVYTFSSTLLQGHNYDISITVHSSTSFCFLPNANANHNFNQTGTVGTSNVNDVNILCVGRITLNEAISNQNTNCASNSADYVELKNISGANITINTNEWYLCDDPCGGASAFLSTATPLFAIPPQTFNSNSYLVFTQNDPGSFTFGLGSNDAINLIYQYGGKNYLVEKYAWSSHIVPARKSPDGSFNGTIHPTVNQPSWVVGPNTSCTKGTTNP